MGTKTLVLAAALSALAPLGAQAADLVVWWEQGFNPEEDAAVREIVAAFERESGKQVALTQYSNPEMPEKVEAALEASQPPDFAFGFRILGDISGWALHDRLADLTDTIGSFSDLFDPDALAWFVLLNEKAKQKALYALPMGRTSDHVHVWKKLLEQAGFALQDIPKEWDPFWSFWCDQVQPAARRAIGRDDIWGVGLSMSETSPDTQFQFRQFVDAYQADYVAPDGKLVIDAPQVRQRLVKALDSYTAIYRKGCTPPGSVSWSNIDDNRAFLAQAVVMTANESLSIPNALKHDRPEDYYKNTATIEWPLGPDGEAFPIEGTFYAAVVFKNSQNVGTAKEFVRFLVAEGWLAHYLDFSAERMLPPMPKLLDAPFWLDPRDPHRMAAVMQIASRPMPYDYLTVSGDWRHDLVGQERIWAKAVHRVVADGISPEQAVDEAIARIKQILGE
jgi:multiple sugar transport system substrate-binding protein